MIDKVYLVWLEDYLMHIYSRREWAENMVKSYFSHDKRVRIEERELTA